MPNPLLDLPPALRNGQVLYLIRFTCPYDGHKFVHSMLMSIVRDDRTMLKHFKMRSNDGKVVGYEIVDGYGEGVVRGKQYMDSQPGYVQLPPGMEAVREADVVGAGKAKEDLLREMGMLSDKADVDNELREDVHPDFPVEEAMEIKSEKKADIRKATEKPVVDKKEGNVG